LLLFGSSGRAKTYSPHRACAGSPQVVLRWPIDSRKHPKRNSFVGTSTAKDGVWIRPRERPCSPPHLGPQRRVTRIEVDKTLSKSPRKISRRLLGIMEKRLSDCGKPNPRFGAGMFLSYLERVRFSWAAQELATRGGQTSHPVGDHSIHRLCIARPTAAHCPVVDEPNISQSAGQTLNGSAPVGRLADARKVRRDQRPKLRGLPRHRLSRLLSPTHTLIIAVVHLHSARALSALLRGITAPRRPSSASAQPPRSPCIRPCKPRGSDPRSGNDDKLETNSDRTRSFVGLWPL